MDVYHQVLVKLYEATEGKPNKSVNLMDLAKVIGLHGNYANILEHLNLEGWIAESGKADFVAMTPWGVREAQKSLENPNANQNAKHEFVRNSNRAANLAAELADLLVAQAKNPAQEFSLVTQKMLELHEAVTHLKTILP